MADKSTFLQIPSTVWWGLRSILQRTPTATITDRYLSVHLDVQDAAARQYLAELKRAGLLDEDGKATSLGNKWRHDDTYPEAVSELVARNYPQELLDIAPPASADRQRVVSWLTKEGLGSGTANNKAATYLLVGSASPNETGSRPSVSRSKRTEGSPAIQRERQTANPPRQKAKYPVARSDSTRVEMMPLNLNVQIHISADASGEQIEAIFSAMRRHLYENTAS